MQFNVGIIGCGLIGHKRAAALQNTSSTLTMVCDVDEQKAKDLAHAYTCEYTTNYQDILANPSINLVIIATTHNHLASITLATLQAKKHILVEKPAAISVDELKKVITLYETQQKKYKIKVGYNHRFHPAFSKAKELIQKENIGNIMFIRARYGHGGRLGYDKEWRANKALSGGGEMLDQGSHLIDLARYFIGDFTSAIGYCDTFFWNMPVEDNCFALLKTEKGQTAQLHASWTQWKNIFSMEIFCETGQINIDGLGRSYGTETLTFYKMKPEMGPPEKTVYDWKEEDQSWEKEYEHFIHCIEHNQEPNGNIYDALATMTHVQDIYQWNQQHNTHPFQQKQHRK